MKKASATVRFGVVDDEAYESFASASLMVEQRVVKVHAKASGDTIVGIFAPDRLGWLFLTWHPEFDFDWVRRTSVLVYRVGKPPRSFDQPPDWSELGLSIIGKASMTFDAEASI